MPWRDPTPVVERAAPHPEPPQSALVRSGKGRENKDTTPGGLTIESADWVFVLTNPEAAEDEYLASVAPRDLTKMGLARILQRDHGVDRRRAFCSMTKAALILAVEGGAPPAIPAGPAVAAGSRGGDVYIGSKW